MATTQFEVLNSQTGDVEYLKITGPLTLGNLFDFQDAVRKATTPKTLIDLSGVPYMDSAGLGAILGFHASCNRNGHKYAICGAASRLETMFQVSKVHDIIHLFPTVQEAEASLR